MPTAKLKKKTVKKPSIKAPSKKLSAKSDNKKSPKFEAISNKKPIAKSVSNTHLTLPTKRIV